MTAIAAITCEIGFAATASVQNETTPQTLVSGQTPARKMAGGRKNNFQGSQGGLITPVQLQGLWQPPGREMRANTLAANRLFDIQS